MALHVSVMDDVPFIRALAECSDETAQVLERELSRSDAPTVDSVRPIGSLVEALPIGMCERLLALPVRLDARTGTVDVAAVDARDSHVAAEFAHALDAPIRIVRSGLDLVLAALADLPRAAPARSVPPPPMPPGGFDSREPGTPVYGTHEVSSRAGHVTADYADAAPPDATPPEEKPSPSAPPIPLVKKPAADAAPSTVGSGDTFGRRPGTNPGFEAPAPETFGEDETGEPVIGLYRSKPPPPPGVPEVAVVDSSPARPIAESLGVDELTPFLEALDRVESPGGVIDVLVEAMSAAAKVVVVFAVRGGTFQGRAGNDGVGEPARLADIAIAVSTPSVFETAVQAGYYLGPLPATPVHRQLGELIGDVGAEVYVTVATVAKHPVLVVLASGLYDSYASSRWADQLARAAGDAFGRILRGKKHG